MSLLIEKKPVYCWLFLCVVILFGLSIHDSQAQKKSGVRLITLSPHLAELVASAGAIDGLVGVVAYSDFPESVQSIQIVGDAFKLDYEAILTLKPDYILSWKGGTPQSVTEKLISLKLHVIETQINTLADIPKVINQIAQLTHTESFAKKNTDQFSAGIMQLKAHTNFEKSIFIETYHQPLYTVSGKHWISEAVSICGYNNIFSDLNQLSVPITLEAVISKNPQSILTISQNPDPQWLKWKNLSAVKNKQIFTIHPDLLSRPSLRILMGIQQLCTF